MILEGSRVFDGIAIGKISVYSKKTNQVKQYRIEDVEKEAERFFSARKKAETQMDVLYQKALEEAGSDGAMIFDAQKMMLEDMDYVDSVVGMIRTQKVNAEFAVTSTCDRFMKMFAGMDDEYIKERAADVQDISNRLVSILVGETDEIMPFKEPVILVAEDLTPSETVQLDKSKLLSIVTKYGSANSHTAILAKTMGIPAMVNVSFDGPVDGELNGKVAIVDACEGKFITDPDEETLAGYKNKQAAFEEKNKLLMELKGKESKTKDGKKIKLYANIGSVDGVSDAIFYDAEGIGLFRSEFLYLEGDDYPTEEAQFEAYKAVVEQMEGKNVTIRTIDVGADKQVEYLNIEPEANPAMGYRAIRLCLDRKEIFKTQLRAIYRAGFYGTISILFPMIASLEEVIQIKEIIAEVKKELDEAEIPYKECKLGIMIETPAAVIISDLLAKEVDFFSIGTNDLTQYTLAIDRQNHKLDKLYNPHHEAVLRMIQMTINNGHKEGIPVGICGELGSDTTLTKRLIEMGIDELSVSPSMVLKVRKAVRD